MNRNSGVTHTVRKIINKIILFFEQTFEVTKQKQIDELTVTTSFKRKHILFIYSIT